MNVSSKVNCIDAHKMAMASVAMVVTNPCSPDPRVERHARWISSEGHDVTIYAWDREHKHPKETLNEGYKIIRTRIGKTKSSKISVWRNKEKFLKSLDIKADLVILNDTDTISVSRKLNSKIILDIHDIAHAWPVMQQKNLISRLASWKMRRDVVKNAKYIDRAICSSQGLSNYYKANFGIDSTVVMNRRDPVNYSRSENKKIGYFGRIRSFESIKYLVEASNLAKFEIILAGDGHAVDEIIKRFPEIDYRGPFIESELPKLMTEINVMYAMYNPNYLNISEGALPVKMFDAAAFGIPTVTTSDCPMGNLCLEENLGHVAKYGDTNSISDAIQRTAGMEISDIIGEVNERKNLINSISELI